VILNNKEKRGGSKIRDPFPENEDHLVEWDMVDIKPNKGNFTWLHKRLKWGHIEARLDRFLVHNDFLLQDSMIMSRIIPSTTSNHKPIALHIKYSPNFGPLPF
jgi:hypothetical protein